MNARIMVILMLRKLSARLNTVRLVIILLLGVVAFGVERSYAEAQVPQVQPGNTVTVKLEAEPAKKPDFTDYLKAFSELLGVVAWPIVFGILLITQRAALTQLLESAIDLIGKSTRIKLGEMIDVEVDRSAKQAEKTTNPTREIPTQELEAAARVGRLIGDSPLAGVRERMLEFAREYEATRSNMKPGPARTRAMNAIVAKMRTLAIAARPLLEEFSRASGSSGNRLVAIVILQLSPAMEYLSWLVARMREEQPFVFFHASLALLATVRSYGVRFQEELKPALEQALQIVTSFKEGYPDQNTVETLQTALSELNEASL